MQYTIQFNEGRNSGPYNNQLIHKTSIPDFFEMADIITNLFDMNARATVTLGVDLGRAHARYAITLEMFLTTMPVEDYVKAIFDELTESVRTLI